MTEQPSYQPQGYPPQGAMPAWTPGPQPDRFGVALAGSVAIAVAGVIVWVILADTAHLRTALVSFAVAIGVAECCRRFAPRHPGAPVIVVLLTVASAVVGLLASQYATVARLAGVSFFTAVNDIPLNKVPRLFTDGTDALTWIILALSVYTGWRQAMRLRGPVMRPSPRQHQPPPAPPAP